MRLLLLAVLLAPATPGQDFRGRIRIKPLVPPLTQPWTPQAPPAGVQVVKPNPAARPCSVPLLQVTPPEVDSAMLVPPPSQAARIRMVPLPAPPCGDR